MKWDEQQAHTIILAKAIEEHGLGLLSQDEFSHCMNAALESAHARGVDKPSVADILHERARLLVEAARARAVVSVEALAEYRFRLVRMRFWLPVVACVMGLLTDRISNAKQVDLLSPPLLAIVGWNLLVYVWLIIRSFDPGLGKTSLLQWLPEANFVRPQEPMTNAFAQDWRRVSGPLYGVRLAVTLHLCAAAWAVGFIVSLLLRGVFVRFEFGWESTFLEVEHVHAIVTALFWPLTELLSFTPFTLQEVAAAKDFVPHNGGGRRWLYMYSGLLMVYVVVPRLLLAAWAGWRERKMRGNMPLDLTQRYFDDLDGMLSPHLRVGLVITDANIMEAVQGMLNRHSGGAADAPIVCATGESIHFLLTPDGSRVNALLFLGSGETATIPDEWSGVSRRATRPWCEVGESWIQEHRLFDSLWDLFPRRRDALGWLKAEWASRNEKVFLSAMYGLTQHLRKVHADLAGKAFEDRYTVLLEEVEKAQLLLHNQKSAAEKVSALKALPKSAGSQAVAIGTGAAAGAMSGAAAGAKVDAMTLGATMGGGAALGAMIGAMVGWVIRGQKQKGQINEMMRRATETGVHAYLLASHLGRPQTVSSADQTWEAATAEMIAPRWEDIRKALEGKPSDQPDPLEAILRSGVRELLKRRFLDKPRSGVGRVADA